MGKVLSPALAFACGYEFGALVTGRYPTISHFVWRLPTWPRVAVWAALAALGFDHAVTRRLT